MFRERALDPDDVRDIAALIRAAGRELAGYDIKVSGNQDRLAEFAVAGASWWGRWIPPGRPDQTGKIIADGPPGQPELSWPCPRPGHRGLQAFSRSRRPAPALRGAGCTAARWAVSAAMDGLRMLPGRRLA